MAKSNNIEEERQRLLEILAQAKVRLAHPMTTDEEEFLLDYILEHEAELLELVDPKPPLYRETPPHQAPDFIRPNSTL